MALGATTHLGNATLATLAFALTALPVFADESLLMTNVHILRMDAPRLLKNRALLVRDGMVTAIGDADIVVVPSDAMLVDGEGGFLMPGLFDMHAHIAVHADGDDDENGESIGTIADVDTNQFPLYLATGVTLLRDPAGSASHFGYRRRMAAGEFAGPDFLFTSPIVDGANALWDSWVKLLDPKKVEPLLARYAAEGYWGVQVYHTLFADVFDAIIASAEHGDLKVIGHISFEVGIPRALQMGIYSIEHIRGYNFDSKNVEDLVVRGGGSAARFRSIAVMTDERIEEPVDLIVLSGMWNTPPLALNRFFVRC